MEKVPDTEQRKPAFRLRMLGATVRQLGGNEWSVSGRPALVDRPDIALKGLDEMNPAIEESGGRVVIDPRFELRLHDPVRWDGRPNLRLIQGGDDDGSDDIV